MLRLFDVAKHASIALAYAFWLVLCTVPITRRSTWSQIKSAETTRRGAAMSSRCNQRYVRGEGRVWFQVAAQCGSAVGGMLCLEMQRSHGLEQ
jgi:hypothetical protein